MRRSLGIKRDPVVKRSDQFVLSEIACSGTCSDNVEYVVANEIGHLGCIQIFMPSSYSIVLSDCVVPWAENENPLLNALLTEYAYNGTCFIN